MLFVTFWGPFGGPWGDLGETLGTLWGTFGDFGSHGVLWDASGFHFDRLCHLCVPLGVHFEGLLNLCDTLGSKVGPGR